jgi:hypothetical protein
VGKHSLIWQKSKVKRLRQQAKSNDSWTAIGPRSEKVIIVKEMMIKETSIGDWIAVQQTVVYCRIEKNITRKRNDLLL